MMAFRGVFCVVIAFLLIEFTSQSSRRRSSHQHSSRSRGSNTATLNVFIWRGHDYIHYTCVVKKPSMVHRSWHHMLEKCAEDNTNISLPPDDKTTWDVFSFNEKTGDLSDPIDIAEKSKDLFETSKTFDVVQRRSKADEDEIYKYAMYSFNSNDIYEKLECRIKRNHRDQTPDRVLRACLKYYAKNRADLATRTWRFFKVRGNTREEIKETNKKSVDIFESPEQYHLVVWDEKKNIFISISAFLLNESGDFVEKKCSIQHVYYLEKWSQINKACADKLGVSKELVAYRNHDSKAPTKLSDSDAVDVWSKNKTIVLEQYQRDTPRLYVAVLSSNSEGDYTSQSCTLEFHYYVRTLKMVKERCVVGQPAEQWHLYDRVDSDIVEVTELEQASKSFFKSRNHNLIMAMRSSESSEAKISISFIDGNNRHQKTTCKLRRSFHLAYMLQDCLADVKKQRFRMNEQVKGLSHWRFYTFESESRKQPIAIMKEFMPSWSPFQKQHAGLAQWRTLTLSVEITRIRQMSISKEIEHKDAALTPYEIWKKCLPDSRLFPADIEAYFDDKPDIKLEANHPFITTEIAEPYTLVLNEKPSECPVDFSMMWPDLQNIKVMFVDKKDACHHRMKMRGWQEARQVECLLCRAPEYCDGKCRKKLQHTVNNVKFMCGHVLCENDYQRARRPIRCPICSKLWVEGTFMKQGKTGQLEELFHVDMEVPSQNSSLLPAEIWWRAFPDADVPPKMKISLAGGRGDTTVSQTVAIDFDIVEFAWQMYDPVKVVFELPTGFDVNKQSASLPKEENPNEKPKETPTEMLRSHWQNASTRRTSTAGGKPKTRTSTRKT